MTKICIAVASPTTDIEAAKFLHQRFKMSLIGSQRRLSMGEKGVFYTCGLYGNDHIQREKEIRDILNFFHKKSIDLLLLEIDDDQDWGDLDMNNLSEYSIPSDALLNVLDSTAGLYE
ncbi:hypothetical protein KDX30_15575 [Pseudomonas sp. CDFA 553]|uniref:hypothetical protein n=1 Tax=Pseudomonas quasicaspiana TaxID=2829821 RepID=UPI001E291140|nr:hypothetical protein [Pseudomonas quasicaspiana]MCD5989319.1 hypothetical protein [Pseudomonas quasicaspiana]